MRTERIKRGLTKTAIARRIHVSDSAYEKWEKGDRAPSNQHLVRWCTALDLPPWLIRKVLSLATDGLYHITLGTWPPELTRQDHEHLESFPFPAFYRKLPEYDIIAANRTARELVPCYTPAPATSPRPANFVEAMLTDQRARTLFGNWTLLAHRMVYMVRTMAPGEIPPQRLDQIVETCRTAPEFDIFWNTDPTDFDDDLVIINHPQTHEPTYFTLRSYTPALPHRPYELLTVTPRAMPLTLKT